MSLIKYKSNTIVNQYEVSWKMQIKKFNIELPYSRRFSIDDDKIVLCIEMKPSLNCFQQLNNQITWRFEKVHESLIDKSYHMYVASKEDPLTFSETFNYEPIKLDCQYFGVSRNGIKQRGLKFGLDSKQSLNLKIMMTFRLDETPFNPQIQHLMKRYRKHHNINAYNEFIGSTKFADFEFYVEGSVEGEKIPAHKAILAAQSEIFRQILNNEDMEQEKAFANVTGVSKNGFLNFLKYLYTDTLNDIDNSITDYLILSEKFGISDMKEKFVKVFIDKLNEGTAADIFQKSHRFNLGDALKTEAFKMIQNKFKDINQEMNDSLIDDPEMVCKLMESYEILVQGLQRKISTDAK